MSTSNQCESNFSHRVYKNNPIELKECVGKKVSVTTEDKTVHFGIVYTIDPVSESVVLLQPKEPDQYSLKIILGHAVKDIEVYTNPELFLPELFSKSDNKLPQTTLDQKKNTIKRLLLENRFPVTETNGILRIEDTVSIEPPYDIEHCICTNSIILSRIQQLIMNSRV